MAQVIIIMGPPGSGKGTQSEILAKKLNGVHLSSGDILRSARDEKLKAIMESGGLVPSEDVCRVVGEAIEQVPVERSIVLDGFTRMLPEAEWLQEFLPTIGRKVGVIVLLVVDEAEAVHRNRLRGREDDDPEAQRERWRMYNQETEPVFNYYRHQGLLREVNGVGSVEEVAERVAAVI